MASPWEKNVAVNLNSDNDPKNPLFDIQPLGPDPLPKDSNGDLIFDNEGHDGFKINFILSDNTGHGYQWPPNSKKDQAVWSKLTADAKYCPSDGDKDVFHALSINGSTLQVRNKNPKPAQGPFRYTLCVTNDGGASYLPLDPGGNNNNGSTKSVSAAAIAVIAVAAVAIAAFAVYRFNLFGD